MEKMLETLRRPTTVFLAALLFVPTPAAASSRTGLGLQRAGSCSAVRARLVDLLTDTALRRQPYRYRRHVLRRPSQALGGRPTVPAATRSESAKAAAPRGGADAPSHFTGTNNQVVGVDEADRVKTDGKYVYTVFNREVLVLKSWPVSATSVVARVAVKQGFTPNNLFLRGNQLLVFSRGYRHFAPRGQRPGWWSGRAPRRATTRVTLLDITDRTAPRAMGAVELEGNLFQARLIGRDAYLVTNNALQLPAAFWHKVWQPVPAQAQPRFRPWGQRPRPVLQSIGSPASVRARVTRALAGVSMQDLLPHIAFFDSSDRQLGRRSLHRCTDLYVPRGAGQLGLLSLTKLNLGGGAVHTAGLVAGGQKVYASRGAVYVATTARRWHWQRRWGYQGTQIHKFRLSGGAPRYAASGVVPGYLLNQFSMDEHRGYLRVATTQNGWGWRSGARGANGLYVLAQRQRKLATVGQVSGLAPGERIYAARMMGETGYIVTFRRTDPLYTLDLSNPREPRVMGELKVNGFSSYIHPLSQGLLLTVGQDADQRGRVRGAHLQIFDVSNLRKPRRTQHYLLTEGFRSSSTAQLDHHAFTFDRRSSTLSLPLSVSSSNRWTGVVLVKVRPRKGFTYLGTVDHADLMPQSASAWRCPPNARCRPPVGGRAWLPINRCLFIDRYVFTLSRLGLEAHDLGQGKPRQVARLRFDQPVQQQVAGGDRPWF